MTALVLWATLFVAQAPDAGRPAAPPLYFDRLLTSADVDARSPDELALMRNTIYARAGQTFRNPKLREYFGKQPWYRPAAAANKLSAVDAANVRTIAARERALLAKPITAACPPPWGDGEVRDPALANNLSALARKLTWEDDGYGAPTPCGRKVVLTCGPDLDGDGLPEAIVQVTWRVLLNDRTCKTIRDRDDYWNVTRLLLVSGNPQKVRAVASLGRQSDEFAGTGASASFVRLRDGRAGVESSYFSEASDSGCVSGETNVFAMERGKLRKVETRSDEPPCDAQ
jgi:YARHG domain